MEASSTARVLVVAHKTAVTPALLNAIRERAARGPARFHLLVPNPHHPSWRPAEAAPAIRSAVWIVVSLSPLSMTRLSAFVLRPAAANNSQPHEGG